MSSDRTGTPDFDLDMGGDQAALEPHESAAGIINVALNANPPYAGSFVNYKGDNVPW